MDTSFMNSEKSKASKSHRSYRCLKRSDIYVVLSNLSTYYTWKKMKI